MKLNRGFTLIELLVVIAIIAILAAILFPVFASAREKARQTTCLSNEQQMGIAMLTYVQDFDETYPMGQYYDQNNNTLNWQNAINPYVKSGQSNNSSGGVPIYNGLGGVYSCPSFPSVQIDEYGAHGYICPLVQPGVKTVPVVIESQISEPTSKILIMEKGQGTQGGFPDFDAYESDWVGYENDGSATSFVLRDSVGDPSAQKDLAYDYDETLGTAADTYGSSPPSFPRYRHSGQTNVLFVDGHSKAMAKGSISGKYWVKYIWIPGVTASDIPSSYEPNF